MHFTLRGQSLLCFVSRRSLLLLKWHAYCFRKDGLYSSYNALRSDFRDVLGPGIGQVVDKIAEQVRKSALTQDATFRQTQCYSKKKIHIKS